MGALRQPSFRFSADTVVATPGARIAISLGTQGLDWFVHRHWQGEWGDIHEADKEANEQALERGYSVLSVFKTELGQDLWLITDAKREITTVLTPSEY